MGYTLKYRYNFKLAYSKTIDQITRLIGPDDEDSRASFITWDNLSSQTVYSANISAPVQVRKGWNAYFKAGDAYVIPKGLKCTWRMPERMRSTIFDAKVAVA